MKKQYLILVTLIFSFFQLNSQHVYATIDSIVSKLSFDTSTFYFGGRPVSNNYTRELNKELKLLYGNAMKDTIYINPSYLTTNRIKVTSIYLYQNNNDSIFNLLYLANEKNKILFLNNITNMAKVSWKNFNFSEFFSIETIEKCLKISFFDSIELKKTCPECRPICVLTSSKNIQVIFCKSDN